MTARQRSIRIGAAAALSLFVLYMLVLVLASGRAYARQQIPADAPFLVFLLPGFGTQVGLVSYLRGLAATASRASGVATGVSGGMSGLGMVACCAHYVPSLLPFVGVSAVATVIMAYRIPLLVLGILSNAFGIALGVRALRRMNSHRGGEHP